jgi:hypothetical protein
MMGMSPEYGRIPMFFEEDQRALLVAHENSGVFDAKDLRVLWIKNTLELEHLYASESLLKETQSNPSLEILSDPFNFPFDQNGNLISRWG